MQIILAIGSAGLALAGFVIVVPFLQTYVDIDFAPDDLGLLADLTTFVVVVTVVVLTTLVDLGAIILIL